ncbi:MAG: type I restriction enzyme HsdR N-terminal domain-containing protein [Chlamydiia bacterium]
MASSLSQTTLFDPIRRRHVVATPEERVRQHLIQALLLRNVPPSAITVERSLENLFPGSSTPRKRIDLAVAVPMFGGLEIRLLAECKAHPLTPESLAQLLAYQQQLQSRWYVLASPAQVWSWCRESASETSRWIPRLPEAHELGF